MKLNFTISENILTIRLEGDYVSYSNDQEKAQLFAAIKKGLKSIIVNGKKLGKWDSSLVSILFELEKNAKQNKLKFELNDIPEGMERLLNLAFAVNSFPSPKTPQPYGFLEKVGIWGISFWRGVNKGLAFFGELFVSILRLIQGKAVMRRVDFLFALEDCSYRALPIVTLISFMVGLILAFVGAMQLKNFGAQIYVASLVTIGMTRIMGAIMTGVIMAGRTGASYAATIGTMQVNEEIDALKTMGVSSMDFLVLPRVLALVITMPLLTMWADFMGMIGGGFVGVLMLDIPLQKYWDMSIDAIALNHFLVGIFHGFVFGIVIALCGCYYGIYSGRNAESVGVATTKAVVSAIVWMIVMTGIITIICQELKI